MPIATTGCRCVCVCVFASGKPTFPRVSNLARVVVGHNAEQQQKSRFPPEVLSPIEYNFSSANGALTHTHMLTPEI